MKQNGTNRQNAGMIGGYVNTSFAAAMSEADQRIKRELERQADESRRLRGDSCGYGRDFGPRPRILNVTSLDRSR